MNDEKKYVICIIGMGNIGQRWLESLLTENKDYDLYCVELNDETRKNLEMKYSDRIVTLKNISDLPEEIDLCAITTTSDVRRQVFEDAVKRSRVKYVIFEKVLFQGIEDYYCVQKILCRNDIKAWVNCTRREYTSYKWLKEKLSSSNKISVSAYGSNWGLGCNGIHIIDLIKYLSDGDTVEINTENLTGPVVSSKRKGFCEFYGSFEGKSGRCDHYRITAIESDRSIPMIISIQCDRGVYIINESKGSVIYMDDESGWEWKNEKMSIPYTSQIMKPIVDRIIKEGKSDLPVYDDSMEIHLKYIEGIRSFLKREINWEKDTCPVT